MLEDVSLDIPPGRWISVVGPNGCGKSTLLRALAGLEPARAGTILLQGRRLQAWPRRERARRLAWLSQTAPVTDLTAAEVVALGRFAHSGWLAHRQADDDAAMHRAMMATGSLAWAPADSPRCRAASDSECISHACLRSRHLSSCSMSRPRISILRIKKMSRGCCAIRRSRCGVSVVSAIHDLSLALTADRVIVLGHSRHRRPWHGARSAEGDWLSAAFETR